MTDAELSARLRANLRELKALQARSGALRMLELPGVRAFALPGRAADSLFQQQVVYAEARALAEALVSLEAWYRELGVHAWYVPVSPGDAAVEAVLARAGHRPEGSIPAMGLALAHPPPQLPPGPTLEHPEEVDGVLRLNGLCSGRENVDHFEAWCPPPLPSAHLYAVLVREGGRALACGVSFEQGDTAGIYCVATHPEARRRGLAGLVMQGLHADARARGCTVAVLQASALGYGLYQRLGYRDLGAWTNWVRRTG
ncbi:GNAT family N-acetyltransferase [Archangium sp.]|uniref:GNAT family N-acetyltransferase n=1 Tax=Archangium sp. TaxID=1872627 RepID=UPI002D6C906B|nr:GNAT family N-acetyltransferase [Archangium sp.]HYO51400.1 GNAT family N-acetyltransferase [Archangium sp.]